MEDEQLVTTAETEEAVKAIATSAQFLLRYQVVLATLAPSIGTQLLNTTEEKWELESLRVLTLA